MESRPTEVTELAYEQGADIQGLRWGVGDIPKKDDFREKRYPHFNTGTKILECKTTVP
jgi:hypothetical protein